MKNARAYWLQIILWSTSIMIVILVGLHYFPKESENIGFLEALYYSLRLFIFEHDLSHFPRSYPLILIHFVAPMIALSAIGTAVTYLFKLSPAILTRWMSDHVVVCGLGRTGRLIAETLKKKHIPVVGVEKDSIESFTSWSDEHHVRVIQGDFHHREVLKKAGANKARSVIFASGDDLSNMEGVIGAYKFLQNVSDDIRLLWAHIANERLADTARAAVITYGNTAVRFFDTYRIAASKMISKYFPPESRKGIREIVILGFGKFGRDLLEMLLKSQNAEETWQILVIDKKNLEKDLAHSIKNYSRAHQVMFKVGDIKEEPLSGGDSKAYFLCTDDDIGNLTASLILAEEMSLTRLFVRMARWPMPAISDNLGEKRGIVFFNINDLMIEGIEDLPGLLAPAAASDLKRSVPERRFARRKTIV
jgi:Trk K+ transport system NAD-binding subunit